MEIIKNLLAKFLGPVKGLLGSLKNAWDSEPAVVLGILGTIGVFAVEQFVGKGVFTADQGESMKNFIQGLIPLLVSLITRTQVSPA